MFVWMLFLCHLQKRKLNASVMTGGAGERFGRWQRPPMEPETEETSHPPLPQVQQREVSGSRIKAAAGQKHRILNWVHLLSSFSLSCFSACSVRPHTWSGATWTVIFWVGLVSVCRLFQLLVFAVIQCANRWYFIWHICLCACKTVHRALEVTESDTLDFSLCWSPTKHLVFGSLALPLRFFPSLGHRCETYPNTWRFIPVYTTQRHKHVMNKNRSNVSDFFFK